MVAAASSSISPVPRESLGVFSKASGGLLARFCFANSALSSATEGVVLEGAEGGGEVDMASVLLKGKSCSTQGHAQTIRHVRRRKSVRRKKIRAMRKPTPDPPMTGLVPCDSQGRARAVPGMPRMRLPLCVTFHTPGTLEFSRRHLSRSGGHITITAAFSHYRRGNLALRRLRPAPP